MTSTHLSSTSSHLRRGDVLVEEPIARFGQRHYVWKADHVNQTITYANRWQTLFLKYIYNPVRNYLA